MKLSTPHLSLYRNMMSIATTFRMMAYQPNVTEKQRQQILAACDELTHNAVDLLKLHPEELQVDYYTGGNND